jgi:arginyl-tRNA synthetase
MLTTIQADFKNRIAGATAELFGVTVEAPAVEVPRDLTHGDLATPVAFEIAKRLKAQTGEKRPPRAIAEALAAHLSSSDHAIPGISKLEVAGAGYVNAFFDRASFLSALVGPKAPPTPTFAGKVLVEHTSVNPNKSAHIGHVRNSVIGDSVVRLLRTAGQTVEVHNWIDDTGVQVADVVVGFLHVDPHSLDEVKAIPDPFDRYCWNLYAKVGLFYRDGKIENRENPEKLELRAQVQHAVESGEGEIYELSRYVAWRNVAAHLRTMYRLGITYDVLPCESEVMHRDFWAEAFELLKSSGLALYVESGKQAGCWVMKAEGGDGETDDEDEFAADKILVKSNGIVTYTGKDIAYHLWKLNGLERDFDYHRIHTYPDGHETWAAWPEGDPGHPRFGHGDRYINVIDTGQSYPQEFVKRAVVALLPEKEGARLSEHLDYEKVGLTVAACDELGFELAPDERSKTFIGMSGRKGRGVIADDLIDKLEASALAEVKVRQRGYSEEEERDIAHKIAVAALRYFLMRYTRNSVIAFDFKQALSFQGETGPYIQNAIVRINAISTKLEAAGLHTEPPIESVEPARLNDVLAREDDQEFWALVTLCGQYPDVIDRAAAALEPAHVAKYAFQLAQSFNEFYQNSKNRIIEEEDEARRTAMTTIARLVRAALVGALGVLGIEAPRRM